VAATARLLQDERDNLVRRLAEAEAKFIAKLKVR
jgi:hypothetical protein